MVHTETEAKVTKLNEKPSHYCIIKERTNTETVKTEGSLEKDIALNIDKISQKAQSLIEKCESVRDITSKAVYNIVKRGKDLTISAVKNLKHLKKQKAQENSLKYAIVGTLALISIVVCVLTCSLGYKVTVGDVSLGIIPSKSMFSDVYGDINENVFALTGKELELSHEPKLSLNIAPDRNILTRIEFTEKLKSASNMMIPAYTVVIDGKMIVALPTEEMARQTVEEYKESFSNENTEAEAKFTKDVKVSYMFAPKQILHTKDSAVAYLSNGEFTHYESDKEKTVEERISVILCMFFSR